MKSNQKKVNVIVPVYADWTSIKKNIKSLKRCYKNNENIEVYYVNDCGPKANTIEKNIVKEIGGLRNFHYARNERNLGFVKNCNNAVLKIVQDKKYDILLLNSDTVVTDGCVEEMQRILYSEDDICAVNPRSNNATVWSVPMDGSLKNRPQKSYRLWLKLKDQIPDKYISPTAHGFCMMIRRKVIDNIGLFDEAYGSGYGEENDFTMRAREAGWKCAVANHAFVFHAGSRSFGKSRVNLSANNGKILLSRYPDYDKLVAKYVSDHLEPMFVRSNGLLYKTFRTIVGGIEYGYSNGYGSALRKGAKVLHDRFSKQRSTSTKPSVQVWTHEITKSGAPLVLFDILRQWRKENDFPENIVFNVPFGARVDHTLRNELDIEGIHFNEVRMSEAFFHNGDVVVINSAGHPFWLYEKIIAKLENHHIKHLYFYIHEDNEDTVPTIKKYGLSLGKLIDAGRVTVYAPSRKSASNWKQYFKTTKNIHSMPGHIRLDNDMFQQISEDDFNKINFIIAGSREVRKGILNVLHALQAVDKYHIGNSPEKYRDFSVTIVGDDHSDDFHNRFIQNEASYFGRKVKLIGSTPHEKIYDLLKSTNFTITYSLADSLSMVTFEGMAFGHPIIRSEASGKDEQLKVGKNGWLANTSNWSELVDAIEEVLNKEKTSNKKLSDMSLESIKIAKRNCSDRYKLLDDLKEI